MSSYKANRNTDIYNDTERANKNNAQTVRNAAKVAEASGHPVAAAIGKGVNIADKATGGKVSEKLGKGLTKGLKHSPGGKQIQNGLNKLNESGAGNKIGQAANIKNKMPNKANAQDNKAEEITLPIDSKEKGKKDSESKKQKNSEDKENEKDLDGTGVGNAKIKKIVVILIPIILVFFLFLLFIIMVSTNIYGIFEDALGASDASGETTGDIVYTSSNKEAQEFYKRINNVKLQMQKEGKSVDALKIVAVYNTLTYYDGSINYKSMSESRIREIADAIFDGNSYNEDVFVENLAESIFKRYFPEFSLEKRKRLAQETLNYIDSYNEFIGKNKNSTCAAQGTCSYEAPGINNNDGTVYKNEVSLSNLKVRLMTCGDLGHGNPIPGEELVDFEKYVLGVVYAEVGSSESDAQDVYKAQAIAARSYAISRAVIMNGNGGVKLFEENGQKILQIRNCTEDQVYCDPDQGCSTTVTPGAADKTGATIFSGATTKPYKIKPKLSDNSKVRVSVSSVMGEVLVDNNGNILYSPYVGSVQQKWISQSNAGQDYRQILLSHYSVASNIEENSCNINGSSNCQVGSSGPYANWKQYEGSWTEIPLGNSDETIHSAGCLATSIAMLIAKSGISTNVDGEFNPGSFVQAMNQNGGFSSDGNLQYIPIQKVAPNFKYVSQIKVLNYSKEEKFNKLQELLDAGYYVTAEVKGNKGQHWVAIDGISGDKIMMMDPASKSTELWSQYEWQNTSHYTYFRVG